MADLADQLLNQIISDNKIASDRQKRESEISRKENNDKLKSLEEQLEITGNKITTDANGRARENGKFASKASVEANNLALAKLENEKKNLELEIQTADVQKDLRSDAKKDLDLNQAVLDKLKESIEAQGGVASENKEYRKLEFKQKMDEFKLRKSQATNKGAQEEIEKERKAEIAKNGSLLQKIAGGISFIGDSMKEKALAVGRGLESILKGTLFAGFLLAVAKFLNSPYYEKTVDYITNTLIPMITNFYENTLKPFVLGIGKFFKDPSWENFKNIFDVDNPLGLVAGLVGLTALFAPKLLFKTLKLGISSFASAISAAGTGLMDLGSDTKKDAQGRTRDKKTGAFVKEDKSKLSGAKNLGRGILRGAKFLPVVGLGVTALMGLFDGVTAGLEEAKNENATKATILRESIAGIGSGLTFGLVSQETISKGISATADAVSSGFNATKDAFIKYAGPDAEWAKNLTAKTQEATAALKEKASQAIDGIKAGFTMLTTDPEGAFNAVSSKLGELTGLELPNFDETKAAITKFGNDMKTKFTDITGVEIPSFDEVKNKLTNLGAKFTDITGIEIPSFDDVKKGLTNLGTNLASKFEGLTGINLGDKFNDLKEMLPDIGNPLKSLADGLIKSDYKVLSFPVGKKLGNIIKSVTASDEEMIDGKAAQGGRVKAGSMYLVNERGSELFVPDQPGQIVSAERTAAMIRKGNMANSASQTPIMVSAPTVNTSNQSVSNSTSSVNYIGNPDPIFQRDSAFAI